MKKEKQVILNYSKLIKAKQEALKEISLSILKSINTNKQI